MQHTSMGISMELGLDSEFIFANCCRFSFCGSGLDALGPTNCWRNFGKNADVDF